jgi:excisionase family DNA binding protein
MNLLLTGPVTPVTLPEQETALAQASSESLAQFLRGAAVDSSTGVGNGDQAPLSLHLVNPATGERLEASVPTVAVRLLSEVLSNMARGHPVTLMPLRAELSTQQAADLLGVSRPYFVKLLEQGKIPFRKVGEQRRVLYSDLAAYSEREREERHRGLDELVALSEEMGLYHEPEPDRPKGGSNREES